MAELLDHDRWTRKSVARSGLLNGPNLGKRSVVKTVFRSHKVTGVREAIEAAGATLRGPLSPKRA